MWYLTTKPWEAWAFIADAFSAEECDKIIEYANKLELKDAALGGGKGLKKEYRSNKIGWFKPGPDTEWLYRKLTDITTDINHQFWQFDLESIPELQFTKYVNEEFKRVSSVLKESLQKVDSDIVKIKITEIVNQFTNKDVVGVVKENQLTSLLNAYELVEEIEKIKNEGTSQA